MNATTLPRPGKIIHLILLLALVVGMLIPALASAEVAAQVGSAAAVNTGTLNIRTGPGVIFAIIGKLSYNEQITLIGKASSGTWVQIRTVGGNVGWVNSIHLRSYADYNLLPITYDTSVIVPPQTVPPPGGGTNGGTNVYVVKVGDTLQIIASRYGTTWYAIAAANGLVNANFIYAGQRLIIPSGGYVPAPTNPVPQPQPNPGTYTVLPGETLQTIAAKFGTTWQAIAAANNLPNANYIYTGQRLIIPAAPRPTQTYVVRQGDTLFSIAQRYGTTVQVIQTANNLPNPNAIYAGQSLQIP